MSKYLTVIFAALILCSAVFAADVFDFPVTAENLAAALPPLNSVSCKFTQEKIFPKSTLKSGGNFHFIKEKGVIFETLYPVKTTASYTSTHNKQINDIITGIANKNYSFINKNFNLYYVKEGDLWTVALKPKPKSPAAQQLKDIIIHGQTNINQININPLGGSSTKINFYCE